MLIHHSRLPGFTAPPYKWTTQTMIYKAKRARAAAPSRPAACVAWVAAPVNSETEEEVAVAVPLLEAVAAWLVAALAALEIALAMLLAADWTALETASAAELVASAASEVTLSAADAAAEVADATAELAADVPSGISISTPASSHVFSTAAMVAAWSSAWQAP